MVLYSTFLFTPRMVVREGEIFLSDADEPCEQVLDLMEKYHLCRAEAENTLVLMQEKGIGEEEAIYG